MKKIIFTLIIGLLFVGNCYGMDKSWIGRYENNQYRSGNCWCDITDEEEGYKEDMIQFYCKNPNQFDINFGYIFLEQVNSSTLNILFKNKKVGTVTRDGNEITIKPNLSLLDKLDERIISEKKGNKKLDSLSEVVSKMKFKKQ